MDHGKQEKEYIANLQTVDRQDIFEQEFAKKKSGNKHKCDHSSFQPNQPASIFKIIPLPSTQIHEFKKPASSGERSNERMDKVKDKTGGSSQVN